MTTVAQLKIDIAAKDAEILSALDDVLVLVGEYERLMLERAALAGETVHPSARYGWIQTGVQTLRMNAGLERR